MPELPILEIESEEDSLTTCDHCGRSVEETFTVDTGPSGDEEWCDSCINETFICCDCDTRFSDRVRHRVLQDDIVCQDCFSEGDYRTCSECGETFRDPGFGSWIDGDWYCSTDCRPAPDDDDDNSENCRLVHGHSYKPRPRFYGEGIHFGVELEIEVDSDLSFTRVAESVLGRTGERAYLKSDSSLNNGFEIVSHPHTVSEHRLLWQPVTSNWPKGIRSFTPGTCGLHVHIERAKLTPLQLGKMLVFVNSDENRPFVETVAQRDTQRWAKIYPKKLTDARSGCQESRYEALNLENSRTVELRIFRGNTRFDRVMKAIEFAAALVDYTREASITDLSFQPFIQFVRKHRKSYPTLDAFLVEKNYLKPMPVKPGTRKPSLAKEGA